MDCKVAFRMEPHVFKTIANYLREKKLLKDSRGVRIEEKLGMFMFMLSHNGSFQDLQSEFDFRIDTKCNGKRGFSVVLVSQMEMGMNFVQPNAQFPVLHKSLSLDIKVPPAPGIKIDIVISRYEDNFLIFGPYFIVTMLHDWHRLVLEYGKPTSEEKANIKKKKACVEEEKSIADAEMDDEKPSREEKESIKKMSISDVEMDDEGHNVRRHSQMKDAGHLKEAKKPRSSTFMSDRNGLFILANEVEITILHRMALVVPGDKIDFFLDQIFSLHTRFLVEIRNLIFLFCNGCQIKLHVMRSIDIRDRD
ncbi:hypothetical protein E2562_028011 [Oryza meyeriana var. granulata]|uniref:DUF8040 domain-containing protein n=1 Tax=Oryza meyeriana var. granulata TaxID=110450 RepID=A0A6G1CU06_9ORYZ|nr:hypothetical protein E2562_028011 [Oryza meyeriana var. granulata]